MKEELKELIAALPSQDYKTTVKQFQRLLAEYPVSLFIDSLDQLENRNEERSKLTFLRDIRPHEDSRIIVSTLPDDFDENGKPGKYFYQCETTLKAGTVTMVDVGIMDQVEETIRILLNGKHRKLTKDQWIVALSATIHEPTILYINLVMEAITQWRRFDKEILLKPVKGLNQIFEELEKSFGKAFTSIAFAMITFYRNGVNDLELKDLLSLHDEVSKEVCQYSKLHCFPMHVWLRLKYVIKNLVAEKENHCIKWYHRQLLETATERYSDKEKECHVIMGRYFANVYPPTMKAENYLLDQPLVLNEFPLWQEEGIVNKRRAVEGYYHLIKAGLPEEVVKEVCSLEFVCCSALSEDLVNCIRYLGDFIRFMENGSIPERLDHYYRWMRKRSSKISIDLQVRMTGDEEPKISHVKKDSLDLCEKELKEFGRISGPRSFGGRMDFDDLDMELMGHARDVTVSWNHDNTKILSASSDHTIKIWDTVTGEVLNTLEGGIEITSASWNHISSQIVSSSWYSSEAAAIKIWDAMTGDVLKSWKERAHSVCWNPDDNKIASGTYDKFYPIKIRDVITGEILLSFPSNHSNYIIAIAWSNDGERILSGAIGDETLKIWNAISGELLKNLEGHSRGVRAVSWNLDNSRIVSASDDKTLKIWDSMTGGVLQTLEGHSSEVHSVSWNRVDGRILSGSSDCTMKVWDALTGKVLKTFTGDSAYIQVRSVSWSFDGRKIVSGFGPDH
jgi:WD40 repeat protein